MSVYKVGSARKPTGNLVSFVGEVGDLFYSIDDSRLRISDGATPGGTLLSTGGDAEIPNSILDLSDADQTVRTTDTVTFGNITTTGYIAGPAVLTIDPAGVGDDTGTVVIAGNLQVDGVQTTINSTTVSIDDLNLTLASGAANASAANGAGITIDGASATFTYVSGSDRWTMNKDLATDLVGNVTGNVSGSAGTVTSLSNRSVGDLSDVDITTAAPTNNQVLVWDNANGKFIPGDAAADFTDLTGTIAASQIPNSIITGDVTATTVNATTVDLGDWTITEASGSLLFATQGVTKMKLDSMGNLDVVGNINSSAYIYSAAALIVNGKNPLLAFDFVNSYYRNSGNDSTFANSLTFTRASSATMMNSSGQVVTVANGVNRLGHHIYNSASSSWVNSGILIESEARTNYVLDSHLQTTNNGAGTLLTTRTVFTENDVVSPDGTTNAAKLAGDGSNNSHKAVAYMQGSGTFGLTDTVTWSVYLKQGTHRYAQIFITDNAGNTNGTINSFYVNVDLQDGTILGDLAAGAIGTHSRIENVGNGWHRVSATLTKQGDNVRIDGGISFSSAGAAISNPILTAGADDYFYVWGAQAEVGRVVSSLIPTSGGAATRAAELLTVAAAKLPSVVTTPIEVSGTEMLTNPGFDTDTDWYKEAGWTIANGVATKAVGTASGALWQDGTFTVTPGKMYKAEIDVTVGQSGSGAVICQFWGGGGGDTDTSPATSSGYGAGYVGTGLTGTYTWYIIPTINRSKVGLISAGGWDGTINSFSLKEVEPYAISSHMKGTLNYNDFGITGAVLFWIRQQYSTTYMNLELSTQTGRTGQVSGRTTKSWWSHDRCYHN
jgi:hypothetical protein